jgi:hypothetical protein
MSWIQRPRAIARRRLQRAPLTMTFRGFMIERRRMATYKTRTNTGWLPYLAVLVPTIP